MVQATRTSGTCIEDLELLLSEISAYFGRLKMLLADGDLENLSPNTIEIFGEVLNVFGIAYRCIPHGMRDRA